MVDKRFKNNNKIQIRQKINPETHAFLYSMKIQLRKTLGEIIDILVENYRKNKIK